MKKHLCAAVMTFGILASGFTTEAFASEQNYEVKSGDTLYRIATNHGLTVQQLMEYNQLTSSTIHVGQKLMINPTNTTPTTYTVQSGDTLYKIANKYGITVSQLQSLNHLSSNTIYVGQVLKIAVQPETATNYTVKAGDSLWAIANKFNMSVSELKSMNGLTSDHIYVGQQLKVAKADTTNPPSAHTVQSGNTLYSIANKYHLSVDQLKSFNQLTDNTIYVGQVLQLKATPSVKNEFDVNQLIAEAKKYMGVPYVWGGTTPAGFDCSGFLHYVFLKEGKTIPRTVEAIWAAGKKVQAPNVGDLVFFETYKAGPSHAGIYLGNGQFIHASSSQGVTISDMKNSYWNPRYLGAKSI